MQFWIRHLLLLVLCVVLPFAAALYFDTEREIDRATASGLARARTASQSLRTQLKLHAHERQAEVVSLASEIEDRNLLKNLTRAGARGEANFIALRELLDEAAGRDGFAWYVDPDGRVLVENGLDTIPDAPRMILAHPVFVETQHGYALDGAWSEEGDLTWVYAAPVARDGVASGAVLVGSKLGNAEVKSFASVVSGAVTLVNGQNVQATTLARPTAGEIRLATEQTAEAVAAGRLDDPLPSTTRLPLLPVFFDPHADGVAYASVGVPVAGAKKARWVVSVNATDGLQEVGGRQEILLGAMFASLLLAILVGLMNSRTFVRPIDTLEAHLSQIQLGRGDFELPERRVSGPFRRLVRLINMTVQKMPTRALASFGPSDAHLSASSLAKSQSSGAISNERPVSRDATPRLPVAAIDASAGLNTHHELPDLLPPPAPPEPLPSLVPVSESREPSSSSPTLAMEAPLDVEAGIEPLPLPLPEHDESDAIAEAIASLEHQLSGPPALAQSRRANEIRGAVPKPYTLEEIEGAPNDRPETGVRGGGSLQLGTAGLPPPSQSEPTDDFKAEATVVAPVQEDLLARSARDDLTDAHALRDTRADGTAVSSVSADLLAQSAGFDGPNAGGLDSADQAHFKEVYERFIDLRRRCGETTEDLGFDRFLAKLARNRENLVKKYACRTVRFQVYEKDGRAALKATPVRAR